MIPARLSRAKSVTTRHAVLTLQPLPPMDDGGRLRHVVTKELPPLPFDGNASALINAAARAYPKRRPIEYFLGMKDRRRYLYLVVSFGLDRSGNCVEVRVDLQERDIPVVATYLFAKMRARDVSTVWEPSPKRRAR